MFPFWYRNNYKFAGKPFLFFNPEMIEDKTDSALASYFSNTNSNSESKHIFALC